MNHLGILDLILRSGVVRLVLVESRSPLRLGSMITTSLAYPSTGRMLTFDKLSPGTRFSTQCCQRTGLYSLRCGIQVPWFLEATHWGIFACPRFDAESPLDGRMRPKAFRLSLG